MGSNFKENAGKAGFQKNPQNINRKGRPRKSFRIINEVLKKKGINEIKKNELIEFYTLIFNATEDELRIIVEDKKTPLALKIILLELKDKKTRSVALKDMRDYMFGQATQEISHTVKARVLTPEEMKDHLKNLEENY